MSQQIGKIDFWDYDHDKKKCDCMYWDNNCKVCTLMYPEYEQLGGMYIEADRVMCDAWQPNEARTHEER